MAVAVVLDLALAAVAVVALTAVLLVPLGHLQHRVLAVLAEWALWLERLFMVTLAFREADGATLGLRAAALAGQAATV